MKPLCPFCKEQSCFVDRHHEYWPRRAYRKPLEREFRGLFIEKLWRCRHNEIHRTTSPPPKPTRSVMERIVETARRHPRG